MKAEELRLALLKLFGDERGWQARAADALGIDQGTMSRYLSGLIPVPGPVRAAVRAWFGERPNQKIKKRPGKRSRA